MEYYNRTDLKYKDVVKSHVLYPMIKIELLDEYENAYDEIIQEISSQNQGTISMNYQSGVRSSVNLSIFDPVGTFLPNPNDKYFWINKKFKIYVGLSTKTYSDNENPLIYKGSKEAIVSSTEDYEKSQELKTEAIKVSDSSKDYIQDIYWFAKGVFIITDISSTDQGASRIISLSGVDKFGAFTNDTGYGEMIGTFSLPKGTKINVAIREILRQDRGNGQLLDPVEPIIDPYFQNYTLPVDLDKGPGSYIGDLLTDLSNTLHADIFYDSNGRLNIWQSLNQDEYKNVPKQWDFVRGDQEYIQTSVNFQINNVANTVMVVGDNPSGDILPQAIAENRNPASPLNINKIGRKSRYIESSTVQTQKEAKDYATYILKTSTVLGHIINFQATLIPHLEVDNIITITDEKYNYYLEEFIITSISYPLGLGTVTINASNIKELPED